MKASYYTHRFWLVIATSFYFSTSIFALSINIQSGKEKGGTYSTIHLEDEKEFICEPTVNEFDLIKKIKCYFAYAPIKSFSDVKNRFFSISSMQTSRLYIITIKPLKKMKIFPISDNLAQKKRIIHQPTRYSKHWFIVGFDKDMPLIKTTKSTLNSINFPIDFSKNKLPFVGALGLDGIPIQVNQSVEVSNYLEVKKFYKRAQYEDVLKVIKKALEKDPDTIFKNEFLLYKIRIKMFKEEYSKVINLCKEYLREYSGSEGIAETLLYIANAYSALGMIVDAEYFFDRLLKEYYETKEATQGLISLAQHSLTKEDANKAIMYLKEALEKAKTKGFASKAAFKLAKLYLSKKDIKNADFYIQKIAKGNIKYLINNYKQSFDIAKEFSDQKAYMKAANLMIEILNTYNKNDSQYEDLLYQIAVWYDLANAKEKAYALYKRYEKEISYGRYENEIKVRMDKVLFEIGDDNNTRQLALYDTISNKYKNQKIDNKSQYLKAKLLYKMKKYEEVLAMQNRLKVLDKKKYPKALMLMNDSAKALVLANLKVKDCEKALTFLNDFNLTIQQPSANLIYECSMKVNNFKEAKKIALPFIYDKNLEKRLLWLYRYLKAAAKIGDFKTVFVMGNDLISLAAIQKIDKYDDIKADVFKAAIKLKKDDKAIAIIKNIEKKWGLRFKEIELYLLMTKLAQKKADETMIETYASKVISLQNRYKSYTFTPTIELTLLTALKKLNKNEKAYKVLQTLVKHVVKSEDIARAYYELGAISQILNYKQEMIKAFKTSSKASKTSPWSKLSQDALDLL